MTPRGWRRSIGATIMMGLALVLAASPHRARAQPVAPTIGKRLALVIGNGDYASGPLPTAANDAALVAQSLTQAGFAVTAAGDADAATLRSMFAAFIAKAKTAGPEAVTLIYLSGYGLQYDGDSYFVPVDAAPRQGADVPGTTVNLADFARALDGTPARARILVEDLSRESPFARQGEPLAGGLPLIEATKGSLVAYNAAPGTVAPPDVAPYGFYARALAEMIEQPDLALGALFDRVRLRVSTSTNGAVIPWDDNKVDGDEALLPPSTGRSEAALSTAIATGGLPAAAAFSASLAQDTLAGYQSVAKAYPRDGLAARVRAIIAARREAMIWAESRRADDPRALWTYMRRYPRGPHIFDARRRLAVLRASLEPPPRFDIVVYPDVAPPVPTEAAIVDQPFVLLDDPSWDPVPSPPRDVLPAPREAFYEDLPPPPPAPAGVLPIPVPVPLEGERHRDADGQSGIVQPGRISYGEVTVASKLGPGANSVMTMLAGGDRVIARTVTSARPGTPRTIVQTSGDGALISRTVTTRDRGTLTTIQSGPSGAVLFKAVSRGSSDGGRATTITNGGDQIVASLQSNPDGVTTLARRGAVPVLEQTYFLASSAGSKPVVASLAAAPRRLKIIEEAPHGSAAPQKAAFPSEPSARPPLPALPLAPPTSPERSSPASSPFGRLAPAPVVPLPAATNSAPREPASPSPTSRTVSGEHASMPGEHKPPIRATIVAPQAAVPSKEVSRPAPPPRRETRAAPVRAKPLRAKPLRAEPVRAEPRVQAPPRSVERPRIAPVRRPIAAQRRPAVRQPPAKLKLAPAKPAPERRAKPARVSAPVRQPAKAKAAGRRR